MLPNSENTPEHQAVNGAELPILTFPLQFTQNALTNLDLFGSLNTAKGTFPRIKRKGENKMKKRWIALLLALTMLLGVLPVSALAGSTLPFTDVKSSDWFYDGVKYVYENGLMSGTGTATFSPNTATTRGMIVTILHRMEGEPTAAGEAFTDVEAGQYYAAAVAWASANGIVGGYGDGTFGPNDPITREQLAAILYRYAQFKGMDVSVGENTNILSYTDFDQLSEWAIPAMQWACGAGLISGVGGGALDPQGHATRAQIATILMRFLEPEAAEEEPEKTEDKGSSDPIIIPEDPSSKSYTVTFDSNGGSDVARQTVAAGQMAVEPEEPTKGNCIFIGWYLADGYSDVFDFSQAVNSNLTLHAKWFDETDTTDSDGDGLTDALEKEFGTDPNKTDTDEDGIPDYIELDWLNYDPTSPDTDQNGTPDAEEDSDGDGLKNFEEVKLGSNPALSDTDFDSLSDYDEVYLYYTNPLNEDTDGDGVTDGKEILIGSDPLVAEISFTTEAAYGSVDETNPVAPSVSVVTDAAGAGTLQIDQVTISDNLLLSQSIAGYLGSAYNFSVEGSFKTATLTFTYDTSLGTIGEDFQPRIYYYNEETQLLEELEGQIVRDGMVTVELEHFSTYILLNKVEFDKVWETEIKPPETSTETQYTGIDVVFVIDSSGSMTSNDRDGLRKEAAKAFVEKLGENDRAAVIDFDSYATIYQEFTVDHALLNAAIDRVNSSGGTNLSAGMSKAIGLFTSSSYTRTDAYKYIIFLTDGDGSYSTSYTAQAKNNEIVVYTIGLGTGVKEATLRAIAEGTGGKYYFASAADDLSGIYTEISVETVDYTTDSNQDGISDYYTMLLNDGTLACGTGSCALIGCTDMYGEESDDWDGDGLKNGEEISVVTVGNRVYVKMYSNPLLKDSDGDGFSDSQEKTLGTPPMEYTAIGSGYLDMLEGEDTYYSYTDYANNYNVLANINAFFDWKKTDESKTLLINYFYDYASQATLDKNQAAIAKLKQREEILGYIDCGVGIIKTAKDFVDAATKLGADTSEVDSATKDFKNAKKETLDFLNNDEAWKNSDVLAKYIKEGKSVLSGIDKLASGENVFTALSPFVVDTAKLVKTLNKDIQLPLGKTLTGISTKYQTFLDSKAVGIASKGAVISVGIDLVEGGVELAEICNTYGKIQANQEAFNSFIELLCYVSDHGQEDYIRKAGGDLAEIVMDESWYTYNKQLTGALGKSFTLTLLKATLDIASDACPYVKLAKAVYDGVKITLDITGITANAKLFVVTRTVNSITNGCISIIEANVTKNQGMMGAFFSCKTDRTDFVFKHIAQLAQSRIVGENKIRERLLKNDLGAWGDRLLEGASKDEVESVFSTKIGLVYNMAKQLKLELSPNLPYYSQYYAS